MDIIRGAVAAVLAVGLVGCASLKHEDQDLPVEKVVLDWKDFYPAKFSLIDDCNTLKTGASNNLSMKVLCFADQSSLGDDRFYLKFTEAQFNKKQWDVIESTIFGGRSDISNVLYQGSSSFCSGNYKSVSTYGYTCTPSDTTINEDVLFVHGYRKKGNGMFSESVILKAIPRDHVITLDDWEYKTAIRIINESLEKL